MIHVFIGTKAQYIKTAPILRQLDAEGLPYNLIDSGQHAALSRTLRRELLVREPDAALRVGDDIASLGAAGAWMAKALAYGLLRPAHLKRTLFRGEGGVCLVHGDTPTTLLAVVLARRAGLRVAHVEAGLRSYEYLNPFPEELIRVLVMRWSDVLFAPSEWAAANLTRMGLGDRCVLVGGNTVVQALDFSLQGSPVRRRPVDAYGLVTIHRVENLHRPGRLAMIVGLLLELSARRPLVFVLHPPTEARLARLGLLSRLRDHEAIRLLPLLPHKEFVHLLQGADFVLTDGGSVQEECASLGKPCLLMRSATERQDGLEANVRLSGLSRAAVAEFVDHLQTFAPARRPVVGDPVGAIIDHLRPYQ
jgi:UDP-N-acetylglucosamine 2-epimerase (non-hydrolysing)